MRKSKFTESQIVGILGEGESGLPVAEVCRKYGISNADLLPLEDQVFSCLPVNSNASRALKLRIASSSRCMPSWRWRAFPSKMFCHESSNTDSHACCDLKPELPHSILNY